MQVIGNLKHRTVNTAYTLSLDTFEKIAEICDKTGEPRSRYVDRVLSAAVNKKEKD